MCRSGDFLHPLHGQEVGPHLEQHGSVFHHDPVNNALDRLSVDREAADGSADERRGGAHVDEPFKRLERIRKRRRLLQRLQADELLQKLGVVLWQLY